MKDLIKVIEQEAYEYSDPITEFLEKLFVSFDFDGAQQKLKECEETIDNDYFLASLKVPCSVSSSALLSEWVDYQGYHFITMRLGPCSL